MKTILLTTAVLLTLCVGYVPPVEPPQAELTNGLLRVALYLPDQQQGYYRGRRFDWAGAFKSLDYKSHSYVDQWFETYDPNMHDAINGPAEEFVALGYTEAKPGETFVKIGVGVLRKPDEKPYMFSTNYDVVDYGKWTVTGSGKGQPADAITFRHDLTDPTGYGYQYTKIVRLTKGKPELVLEHSLKNTGRKSIETSTYNHNFWIIDKQPTGPSIAIRFPFEVNGEGKGFGTLIQASGKSLMYSREFEKRENVFSAGLQGFGPTKNDYDIRIENQKTGAGLRATADQPLEKLVYWACATTSCPEPYLRLIAAPGQTIRWTIAYTFYEKTAP